METGFLLKPNRQKTHLASVRLTHGVMDIQDWMYVWVTNGLLRGGFVFWTYS